jgi:L-seryl-tRNA(Ser) seleniumtransferase
MNAALLDEARLWLETLLAPTLHPVINATGIIIHTNLGRAPLSEQARLALQTNAAYGTLEYDVATGSRGSRSVHARQLLTRLTGAEDALVVNNNAAAVLLMLRALCREREVVISRGQLVEIGGGFRVPDVMAESGARLVEVGTTNRTHVRDYAGALHDETAAILVAHHSNFKIVGFATEPSLGELAKLAHDHELPLLYDQGSGAFLDTAAYGLAHEPTVMEALHAGVDLVAFSGDKLLGGPQAGVICGRGELVERLRQHPLARALRPDKLCLAALVATLTHYLVGEAEEAVPVWQMISQPKTALQEKAEQWTTRLQEQNVLVTVVDAVSMVGGGSLPGTTLPTSVLAIDHPDVEHLARTLRSQMPAIITRISDNRLVVDPRTVLPDQEETLLTALAHLARTERGRGPEASVAA